MANYDKSYSRTAYNEGGYQANPSDQGNYNSAGQLVGTNWGISAKVYEDWLGRRPTAQDMMDMTKSTAKAIFRAKFWNKIKGDQLPNQYVADILFDGVVNHGQGVRLAQEVLGITQDNVFGQETYNKLVNTPPGEFYNKYKERRRQYYYQLAQNPSQLVFLNGWLKRLDKYNDFDKGVANGAGVVLAVVFLLLIGIKNKRI